MQKWHITAEEIDLYYRFTNSYKQMFQNNRSIVQYYVLVNNEGRLNKFITRNIRRKIVVRLLKNTLRQSSCVNVPPSSLSILLYKLNIRCGGGFREAVEKRG